MGRSIRPGAAGGHELWLVREVGVAADEISGAVEDGLVGAPVVGQRQAPAREPRANVFDLGVAPAVDRLLRVADDSHVPEVVCSGEADEVELDAVGVLELVHDQVAEALPAPAPKLGHALERVDDLEQEIVEVTQRLVAQPVLVGAVDGEQHLDRLELRTTRVWTFRTIGGRTRAPLPLVDLERALAETLGTDAAALELEQEAKARTQQVIEVVDREGGERVWVERRGGAAAQLRHQLLLEKTLACLVQDTQLACCADEVGVLVEQAGANAVKGHDPCTIEGTRPYARPARRELVGDPHPELLRGAVAERDSQDLDGSDPPLHQPAEARGGGERLPGARAGGDQERALRPRVRGGGLLGAQCPDRSPDASRAHSGGAPP